MGLQVVNRRWNGLIRRTVVECGFRLLSALPSVAVHVVGAPMIVVDADGLPIAVLKNEQHNRVALDWRPRLIESHKDPLSDGDIYRPLVGQGEGSLTFTPDMWQLCLPGAEPQLKR